MSTPLLTACPRCASADVVPVVHGFPSKELIVAARRGQVRLGGCVIDGRDDWDLAWHCRPCGDDDIRQEN